MIRNINITKRVGSNVVVEFESERVLFDDYGQVTIYDGDEVVAKVIAKIELRQGADGGLYPVVEFKESENE